MLIKNGYLIDPASGLEGICDVRIEGGTIIDVGILQPQMLEEVFDISGLTIAPGLIDTHVHFRDPGFTHKEDLHTGSLAAAKGGFTSVVCMANTKPAVDNVDTLKDILSRAKEEDIHIYQAASVTQSLKGQKLNDLKALAKAGACGFTDDGIPVLDPALCYDAMQQAQKLKVPISLHEENPMLISENGINQGKASRLLGIGGSPAAAEDSMVKRDCMLALQTGADVVIQHISSAASVGFVREAKANGAHIHAEATPHHFTLTEDAVAIHGSLAKMNPPLRTETDRLAIIEGLKDGTIDLIATDHAPHSAKEKAVQPMWTAPSGIIGLETALGLGITSLVEQGHLSLMDLLEKMTCNPAELYHLPAGKITEGAPADFVIFDPKEQWIVTEFASKSSNSPFTGASLYGKIYYTICNGKIVYAAE